MSAATDSTRERLRPAEPAGEGYEWAAVEESPDRWRVADVSTTCRGQGPLPDDGTRPHAHGVPATVQTLRGLKRRVWWRYCDGHAADYGRWLENGRVMHWIRREVG
jgi:hypothetical protein